MVTARAVIRRSLLLLAVVSSTEPLQADEAADGLATLNALLASWANERCLIYHVPRLDVPLVPGKGAYTWGPGGDIAAARPLQLEGAVLRVTEGTDGMDWPVAVLSQVAYDQGVTLKGLESTYPCAVYYETAFPLGVLHVYFVPQTATTLGLFPWLPLTAFSSLDTLVSLPEGYERALVAGLAADLAPMYGKEVSPTIAAGLAESKSAVKRVNAPHPVLGCDAALSPLTWEGSDWPGFVSGQEAGGRGRAWN